MKKTLLALTVALMLVLIMVPVSVSAAEGTAVTNAAEFKAMKSGESYYLANDIDFGGERFQCYILQEFSGKLDGNGFGIYNFSIDGTDVESDCGIIQRANKVGNLEITNLTIGTKDAPISLFTNASGKSHGILFGAQENSNSSTITNVTIYANLRVQSNGKANAGGYIGYSRVVTFESCNIYGVIEVGSGMNEVDPVYHNAAGYIGSANNDMTNFIKCENNAEIISYCSEVEARAAGFVSYTAGGTNLTDCANYGKVTVYDCGLQMADGTAAGFIGHANKTTPVILENCTNYGEVSASNWCSAMVAHVVSGAFFSNCVNEGTYNTQALVCGPFVGNVAETAIVEYESLCVDKMDTSVIWGPAETTTQAPTMTTEAPTDTTTEAPAETEAPADTTTAAPDAADTTTAAPTTQAPTTEAPKADGGCSSVMMPVAIVAILGCAWVAFSKKK